MIKKSLYKIKLQDEGIRESGWPAGVTDKLIKTGIRVGDLKQQVSPEDIRLFQAKGGSGDRKGQRLLWREQAAGRQGDAGGNTWGLWESARGSVGTPYQGWLKQQDFILTVPGGQQSKIRASPGLVLEAMRQLPSHVSLPASGDLRVWSLAFLDLQKPHPNLCLHLHLAFSMYVSVSRSPLFVRTPVTWN